jgi:hypothetical protein
MSREEEIRRLLAELEQRHGRRLLFAFMRWWLSRRVADTPPRSRGYAGPLFTHGAFTTRTRLSNCQRERNR